MDIEECNNITRIEIIDESGRVYTTGSFKTEVSMQDDGKTIKIFITVRPYMDIYKGEQEE